MSYSVEKKPRQVKKRSSVPATEKTTLNPIKLGQVLVRAGRIRSEDLEQALREQDASKKRIGEILIEKGFIKPEELTHGLMFSLYLLLQECLLDNLLIQSLKVSSPISMKKRKLE